MHDKRAGRHERPERGMANKRQIIEAALSVLAQTRKERPADRVMRDMFRVARGLDGGARRWISNRVFAYYRWKRWCQAANEKALHHAWDLQLAYQASTLRLSASDLRQGAIPDWLKGELKCPTPWLASLQRLPRVWMRARLGEESKVMGTLSDTRAPVKGHPQCLEYTGEVDLYRTALFRAGSYELQDVASQAVGWLCAPRAKERWWDACAGAGGKMLLLADLMHHSGLIWASDRSARRLTELKRRAGRAGVFNYRTCLWVKPEEIPVRTEFDGVLLDAPCSGIGTWQRNPHARWTTTPEDVRRLAEIQSELLARAALRVRKGGRLIYSVCTLTDRETTQVVRRFNETKDGFEPVALKSPFETNPGDAGKGTLCLWPHVTGGDGMFVAAWKRV